MSTQNTQDTLPTTRVAVIVGEQTWAELKAEAALERRNPSELADDAFRLYLRTKKAA